MAATSPNAAQLILLAQQEIHHCQLQRRGLDMHLSALESLLKQVGEVFNINPSLQPSTNLSTERAASQGTIDPPGFGPDSPQQLDALRKGGRKAGRRAKGGRGSGPGPVQKPPPQILKAPARSGQLLPQDSGPPAREAIPAIVPNPQDDGNDDDTLSSPASLGSRSAATSDSHHAAVGTANKAGSHLANGSSAPFDMSGPLPSLWVGSLAPRIDKPTIEGLFRYPPTSCKLVAPPGRQLAFAIVTFANAQQTAEVLADDGKLILNDRAIPIRLSNNRGPGRRPPPRRQSGPRTDYPNRPAGAPTD